MEKQSGLSAYQLKGIAVFAMVLDHIAWAFLPLPTAAAQLLHGIGRLTAPIMCFFLAEGYFYTSSRKRYLIRLGLWAIPSAAACLFFTYTVDGSFWSLGVVYTLFLDLLAIEVCVRPSLAAEWKYLLVFLLALFSIPGDGGPMHMFWALNFALRREDRKKQFARFAAVMALYIVFLAIGTEDWESQVYLLGIFGAIPLLACYNGRLGGKKSGKWFFYWFYPAHLLALGGIRLLCYNI